MALTKHELPLNTSTRNIRIREVQKYRDLDLFGSSTLLSRYLEPVVEGGAGGEGLQNGVDKTRVARVHQPLHILAFSSKNKE
jgi:hypothetical protein